MAKFIYFKTKYKEITQSEKFQEMLSYTLDFLITGVCLGSSIFLLKSGNSFAQGFGFAILLGFMQYYVKWFADIVKEIKLAKR
jgi:hypothetical protein